MQLREYNMKGFLLPESINSMAAYHAKLFASGHRSGEYMFRIHDCNAGIRLTGKLDTESDIKEAKEKLLELANAACEFVKHLDLIYTQNFENLNTNI